MREGCKERGRGRVVGRVSGVGRVVGRKGRREGGS